MAIEPEPSNFELLVKNTRSHANVKPICAGLWSRRVHLRIENAGAATWSFRVVEDSTGQGIPALGIPEILADFNMPVIDVLKIDIEGSEIEVLGSSEGWIDNVGTMVLELHDRFRPGRTEALEAALSGYEYRRSTSGESVGDQPSDAQRRSERTQSDCRCGGAGTGSGRDDSRSSQRTSRWA